MNTKKNVFVRMFETLSLIRAVGEKIVEEIMAEPERKKELLVRQGKKWLKN